MKQKIVIALVIAAVATLMFWAIPRWVKKKEAESKAHYEKIDENAKNKADELVGEETGGGKKDKHGFGGYATRHARETATEAHTRSRDHMEEMAEDEYYDEEEEDDYEDDY